MEELRDIENFVVVQDQSLLYFSISIISLIIVIILIIIIFYWILKPKKIYKKTPQDIAKIKLLNIDFDDTKKMIYTFSENIQIIIKDDKELNSFLLTLDKYKFRKHIPDLDDDDLNFIKDMIEKAEDDRYYK